MAKQKHNYKSARPGDRVIFEREDGTTYGGVVWRSPTTGDLLAGDTFLTLRGSWLPEPASTKTTFEPHMEAQR